MNDAEKLFARLLREHATLVTVAATQGSVPREQGAWMGVFADEVLGTIGGGHLELQAIERARKLLKDGALAEPQLMRHALGPSLGQCCGGVMHLRYERIDAVSAAALRTQLPWRRQPVALFGGGHVGKALIRILGELPLQVRWIDSRDEIFPADIPANVECEHSDPVQAAVRELPAGAQVLIMSFSHAEDLDVVAACLMRQRERADLAYIGLIGSKTKWAVFRHRLAERGFSEDEMAHVTSPIGVPGIAGKEPEVIAVAVAAQLLQAAHAGVPAAQTEQAGP